MTIAQAPPGILGPHKNSPASLFNRWC